MKVIVYVYYNETQDPGRKTGGNENLFPTGVFYQLLIVNNILLY
jgi:hypothetical protein